MKITYLTPGVFDKGGISRYCRYQINVLRELLGRENVQVISRSGPKHDDTDFEMQFDVTWQGSGHEMSFAAKNAFLRAAILHSLDFRPDLIWAAHLYYSSFCYILAKAIRAYSLVQVYGREVWTHQPWRPDIFWGLEHCDFITSDSHFTAEYVTHHRNIRRGISVMWDPVDVDRFSPVKSDLDDAIVSRYGIPIGNDSPIILTLGRLKKETIYKGYSRLLSVFAHLPKNVYLVFGGGGDLIDVLREQAKALGVQDRVIFTGFIADSDLPAVYRAASVFCLIGDRGPERGEGVPLTPLEAAACGIPIIVGNQDGSREAVIQGKTGYAIDPFELDEIKHLLLHLITDATSRNELGKNARNRIEEDHSLLAFSRHHQQLLCSIADISEARKSAK